jgi:hypothetical protein
MINSSRLPFVDAVLENFEFTRNDGNALQDFIKGNVNTSSSQLEDGEHKLFFYRQVCFMVCCSLN